MASLVIDPRSRSYYAQFFDKSRRPKSKRVSLKTKKRRIAERALARLEDRYAEGKYDPWAPATTASHEEREDISMLRMAAATYLASCAHLKPKTVKTYQEIVLAFVRFCGEDAAVAEISARNVLKWLDSTNAGVVTRHKYTNHLGYFFRFLVRVGRLDRDISKEVPLGKMPEQAPKSMTLEEVDRIVETIENYSTSSKRADFSWLVKLVRFNVHVGLRRGELIHLRWEHIELERRILRVVNSDEFTTKSAKERTIPLSDSALRVLRELRSGGCGNYVFELNGEKLNHNTLTHYFRRFRCRAALPEGINFHSTRHTFGTWLAERGVPVVVIQRLMGHSSVKTTERYMNVRADLAEEWIRRVFR